MPGGVYSKSSANIDFANANDEPRQNMSQTVSLCLDWVSVLFDINPAFRSFREDPY